MYSTLALMCTIGLMNGDVCLEADGTLAGRRVWTE